MNISTWSALQCPKIVYHDLDQGTVKWKLLFWFQYLKILKKYVKEINFLEFREFWSISRKLVPIKIVWKLSIREIREIYSHKNSKILNTENHVFG